MSTGPKSSTLRIAGGVGIRQQDLRFEFSRSAGPGGQNVNKVSTRVTLRFDVGRCAALTDSQRRRIRERLGTRITRRDVLMVVSSKHRTQAANRKAATERFVVLLAEALKPAKRRKATQVPRATRERRLREKAHRSLVRRFRSKRPDAHE